MRIAYLTYCVAILTTTYYVQKFRQDTFRQNVTDHAKIQARHISSKCYRAWIQYNPVYVVSWSYQCKVGSRVVGTRFHVTDLILYHGKMHDSMILIIIEI